MLQLALGARRWMPTSGSRPLAGWGSCSRCSMFVLASGSASCIASNHESRRMAQRSTISSIRDISRIALQVERCALAVVGAAGGAVGGTIVDITMNRRSKDEEPAARTHVLRPALTVLEIRVEDSVHCVQIQILIPPLPPWVKPSPPVLRGTAAQAPGWARGAMRSRGQNPRSVRVRSRGRGVRHQARHGGMTACTHDGAWTSVASWTEHTQRSGGPVWRMSGVRIQ